MAESGEVDREIALRVLRHCGVSVLVNSDEYTLSKNDVIETHKLQSPLSRRMIHYLSRTFDVSIHLFYNPDMQEGSRQDNPPNKKS